MLMLKTFVAGLLMVWLGTGFAPSALAQNQLFAFDFHSVTYNYDATGTLLSSPNGDGSYTAISGNLTVPASVPAGAGFQSGVYNLLPAGFYGGNDNQLFPGQDPVLDENGVSFGNSVATYEFNLYSTGTYVLLDSNGNYDEGTLTLTAVANLQITSSGLVYNRGTQIYTGTVMVKNNTQQPISGMLRVLFSGLTAGVTLTNAAGSDNGVPYLSTTIASLAPGACVTLTVQFSDPSSARVGYTAYGYTTASP